MSELLNCPFCGSEAVGKRFGARDDLYAIECGNRFGPCCHMSTVATPGAIAVLEEKWNTRYPYKNWAGEIVCSPTYHKTCEALENCEEVWK